MRTAISLSFFALLLVTPGRAEPAPSRPGSVAIPLAQGPFPVGYRAFPATLDPAKPTIVYVPGGPIPFVVKRDQPPPLLPGVQVILVDYLGTARSAEGIQAYDGLPLLRNFTSDNQARVIAAVIRQEGLRRYVLWGQSHGVQECLRTLELLQRDPTAVKPVAVVLDSGVGRPITPEDESRKEARGVPGPHGRCVSREPPPEAPAFDAANVGAYAQLCGMRFPNPAGPDTLLAELRIATRGMLGLLGPYPGAARLEDEFGCPPFAQIDYPLWQTAMSCGSFTNEFRVTECLAHAPEQFKEQCHHQPPCGESPLGAAGFEFGGTPILGFQSLDDCTNWQNAMDDLMANFPAVTSAYVRVAAAGGHVTFPNTPAWQPCLEPETRAKVTAALFSGDVTLTGKILAACYRSVPTAP